MLHWMHTKTKHGEACTCRCYGQVTAVDTEQQTIQACFANGSQDKSYKLSGLIALQQKKKLDWVSPADMIVSALDAVIKYFFQSGLKLVAQP